MSRKRKAKRRHAATSPAPSASPPLRSDRVPEGWHPGLKTLAWMRLGEWGRSLGLRRVARFAARRVERLVESQPFAQMWVAQTLVQAGDVAGALKATCSAEGWPEGDARAYEVMGFDLRGLGRAREAQALFAKAIARGSADVDMRSADIATALAEVEPQLLVTVEADKRGELSERLIELLRLAEAVVEQAPERADSHMLVASCLMALGRRKEACAVYRTPAALQPDSPEIGRLVEMASRPPRLS